MKVSVRGWLVLGIFAAVVAGLVALGLPFAKAAPPDSPDGRLDQESLGSLLSGMGLQTKQQEHRYDFTFKAVYQKQDWDLSMSTVLSRDGKSIWLMAWLDELPRSAAEVPRVALLRLLAENDQMGNGKFFAYIPGSRRFVLQKVIPNNDVTPETMREALRDLGTSVVDTYPQWSVANWKASGDGNATTAGKTGSASKSAARPEQSERR